MGCEALSSCLRGLSLGADNDGGRPEELVKRHPCYSEEAHKVFARMHLPVAPRCNVQCNFCSRRYDCANENRPGVSSEVLKPFEALCKVEMVIEEMPNLTVVGIAGPGDPLANPKETFETLRLLKARFPHLSLCLSTNGLMLPYYLDEIRQLGISHLTITVNMVDPAVGEGIYRWVRYQGKTYRGQEGAALLSEMQLKGLKLLAEGGVLTKVNIVMIPGVNDHHIPEIVAKVKRHGAFLLNIMPMIPASGSFFENLRPPTEEEYRKMQELCENGLRVMRHCKQCRADAIGLLGDDRSRFFTRARLAERFRERLGEYSRTVGSEPGGSDAKLKDGLSEPRDASGHGNGRRLRFAVASKDNRAVNLHFGHARSFHIWDAFEDSISYVEPREVMQYCLGKESCAEEIKIDILEETVKMLDDCDYLLCSRIGPDVRKTLGKRGIEVVEVYDYVVDSIKKAVSSHKAKVF